MSNWFENLFLITPVNLFQTPPTRLGTPERVPLLERAERIMVERLWFPRFIGSVDGRQRWEAYSWVALQSLSQTLPAILALTPGNFIRDNPVDALIAAADWWDANVGEFTNYSKPPSER